MLSFAIPGTVVGVAYILAFNVPPIELTGTGLILVICFVFRNMPVGVRAGIAAMSQIDRSLDEASLMLRARSLTTLRYIIVPLLRPAIIASLIYAFVRAMTRRQRDHFSSLGRIQHGHRLYCRPCRSRRIWLGHRLFLDTDPNHADGDICDPAVGRRTPLGAPSDCAGRSRGGRLNA